MVLPFNGSFRRSLEPQMNSQNAQAIKMMAA
jgi:hypothetical protein